MSQLSGKLQLRSTQTLIHSPLFSPFQMAEIFFLAAKCSEFRAPSASLIGCSPQTLLEMLQGQFLQEGKKTHRHFLGSSILEAWGVSIIGMSSSSESRGDVLANPGGDAAALPSPHQCRCRTSDLTQPVCSPPSPHFLLDTHLLCE